MLEQHPADAALRFLAMYSEALQAMDSTLRHYLERTSPEVGKFVSKRVRRLSDEERIAAMTALAADVGAQEQWEATPMVVTDLKSLRDTIGHSTLMGSVENERGELHVYATTDIGMSRYMAGDLMAAFFKAWWALEQVLFVASVAGERAVDGSLHRRHSGVSILEGPPSRTPAVGPIADPVVIWERLDGDD
jgi:hypothetical protein